MLEHVRRRVTQYRPATPMRPDHRGAAAIVTRYGGVGASAALALLPDARGIAFVAPPNICPHGARNATVQGPSET
jgi:hypothetical protein